MEVMDCDTQGGKNQGMLLTIRGYLKLSLSREHSLEATARPCKMGINICLKKKKRITLLHPNSEARLSSQISVAPLLVHTCWL